MNVLNKSKVAVVFVGGFLCGVTYLISCGKVNVNSASATGSSARQVKANGTTIGEFISLTNALDVNGSGQSHKVIVTMSSAGFLVPIGRDGTIDSAAIYFSGSSCTGTSYVRFSVPKSVFRNGTDLYYVAASATISGASVTYESFKDRTTGACTNLSSNNSDLIETIANNSAVTGVSVNGYTAPITIE